MRNKIILKRNFTLPLPLTQVLSSYAKAMGMGIIIISSNIASATAQGEESFSSVGFILPRNLL